MSAGDRVKLVKIHQAMGGWLKGQLGREGVVLGPCEPDAVKYRVSFDGFSAVWVAAKCLSLTRAYAAA